MGSYIKSFNKILFTITVLALLFISASCSQNTPDLNNASYSVIFDFPNSEANPNARLSIFVESESDVRRYDTIKVVSQDEQYIWNIEDIKTLKLDDLQFAGATNLVVPENEIIPCGTYFVTCINADEKEAELQLTVNYDEQIYELKEDEVADYMKKNNGSRKIAIYDKENVMIYFGIRTTDLQTTRDIWNYYRNAEYYQDIWCISGNRVICILPPKKVEPEK